MVSLDDLPEVLRQHVTVNPEYGCWECDKTFDSGYGRMYWQGKSHRAHRLVWILLVGPIPPKITLDHVKARGCQSRACCWPEHMDPVTIKINIQRARQAITHCPKGHRYTKANTRIAKAKGGRVCKTCEADRVKAMNAAGYVVKKHRVTHCPAKHEYTPENTIVGLNGSRSCRKCKNAKKAAKRAADKLAGRPRTD